MACKEPSVDNCTQVLQDKLLHIKKPLIVANILCLEGFFGTSTFPCSPITCIIKDITPSISVDEQKRRLADHILKTIQSKESDQIQLKESLIFLSTVLLRFDSAITGITQVPCFRESATIPDAFPSTYRTIFDAVQKVCESNEIDIEAIISFLRESYPELHEAGFCTSYNDVFNLLYTYSSLMNTVYLKEFLQRFNLYQQAVIKSEMDSHDSAVQEFCSSVTVQEAADEKYGFMPDCNRRFLILDTVEFRLDLECQCKTLSYVLKLIKETFPQLFCYVQLRCVHIEAYAVSIKCFAPYDLHFASFKRRDMAAFLEEHRCVLSISVGGGEIAQQNSEKEDYLQTQDVKKYQQEIKKLHLELDKEQRKMKDISCNAEFVQSLSDDLDKKKKQLEENNERLEVTQKMLKGTQMELERERQKTAQKHEDSRKQEKPPKKPPQQRTLFQKIFGKSTPQEDAQSFPEPVVVPTVASVATVLKNEEDTGQLLTTSDHQKSQKKRNVVVPRQDPPTHGQPMSNMSTTDYSENTESTNLTSGTGMKHPIPVNTDSTTDGKIDKTFSLHYSYPADEAQPVRNDLYYNQLDKEIKEESDSEPTQ